MSGTSRGCSVAFALVRAGRLRATAFVVKRSSGDDKHN